MGWPRLRWVRGQRPGRSPTARWVPRSQPRLPAGRASFPNMVCSLLDGAHSDSVGGAGRPAHPPPPSDPRTRSHPSGSPQPLPHDHRKCQQSESQENPSSPRGRVQTGACPRTPPTSEEGRPRGRQRGFRQCWPLGRLEGSTQGQGQRERGTGWEGGPGPRRVPKELLGHCAACEHVEQSACGDRTVQGGPRRAGQRLQRGHTAAGAWHQERLGLHQLVPTAAPSPRAGLATAPGTAARQLAGHHPGASQPLLTPVPRSEQQHQDRPGSALPALQGGSPELRAEPALPGRCFCLVRGLPGQVLGRPLQGSVSLARPRRHITVRQDRAKSGTQN